MHRKGICCVTHEPVESSYEKRSENKDKWYFCGRRIRSAGCYSSLISVGNSALGYLQRRYVAVTPPTRATSAGRPDLEKLCNAVGLPPVLCVFLVLGVCIGLLGIARSMNDMGMRTHGSLGNPDSSRLFDVTSRVCSPGHVLPNEIGACERTVSR